MPVVVSHDHPVDGVVVVDQHERGRREPHATQGEQATLADRREVALPDLPEHQHRQDQHEDAEQLHVDVVEDGVRGLADLLVQPAEHTAVVERVVQRVGGADDVLADVEQLVAGPGVDRDAGVRDRQRLLAVRVVGVPHHAGVAMVQIRAVRVLVVGVRATRLAIPWERVDGAHHAGAWAFRERGAARVRRLLGHCRGADQGLDAHQGRHYGQRSNPTLATGRVHRVASFSPPCREVQHGGDHHQGRDHAAPPSPAPPELRGSRMHAGRWRPFGFR